eukprot:4406473-Alexandrium_andersonii.AAC.1
MAAIWDIRQETGVEVDVLHTGVYRDVGWSYLREMCREDWARHRHCPTPRDRPMVSYRKKARYHMAEASGYDVRAMATGRTDGRPGRVGWVSTAEARGSLLERGPDGPGAHAGPARL